MDGGRFDATTKALLASATRRDSLRALIGGGLGGGLARLGGLRAPRQVAAACGGPNGPPCCKAPGKTCESHAQCCSNFCRRGKCSCRLPGESCSGTKPCCGGALCQRGACVSAIRYVLVDEWGGPGSGNGQFDIPTGVAVDQAGCVYIAERLNHRVQKFVDGAYVAKWGSQGSGDGQFNEPFGIAVDLKGRVYVADWGNHRIQAFVPA